MATYTSTALGAQNTYHEEDVECGYVIGFLAGTLNAATTVVIERSYDDGVNWIRDPITYVGNVSRDFVGYTPVPCKVRVGIPTGSYGSGAGTGFSYTS